jgi:hypothetical protein
MALTPFSLELVAQKASAYTVLKYIFNHIKNDI